MNDRGLKISSSSGCWIAFDRGGRIKILGEKGRSRNCVEIMSVLPSRDTRPFISDSTLDDMMLDIAYQVNATAPNTNG